MRSLFFIVGFVFAAGSPLLPTADALAPAQDYAVAGGIVQGVSALHTTDPFARIPQTSLPIARYEPFRNYDATDLAVVNAHASVILDAESGTILHNDDATQRRQIASLTKLSTAMYIVDRGIDFDDYVTISDVAYRVAGTKIGCQSSISCYAQRAAVGEQITVRDAVAAILVSSSNDAAVALAEYVDGSEETFVRNMNAHVRTLGLTDTQYCRASGLEHDNREHECYSTAYDVAKVMARIVTEPQYAELRELMQIEERSFQSRSGQTYRMETTNKLFGKVNHMVGAKTGFTPAAGYSLAVATYNAKGQHPIIAVELDNPHRWRDAQQMIGWVYDAFTWK